MAQAGRVARFFLVVGLVLATPVAVFFFTEDGIVCVPAPLGRSQLVGTWQLTSEPNVHLLHFEADGALRVVSLDEGIPPLHAKTRVRELSWSVDAGTLSLGPNTVAPSDWAATSGVLTLSLKGGATHVDSYRRVWCLGE